MLYLDALAFLMITLGVIGISMVKLMLDDMASLRYFWICRFAKENYDYEICISPRRELDFQQVYVSFYLFILLL